MFINACNQDILSLWRGNVDLQYIINEIAAVKYVCSYMTKGEKGMGETLKRVAKECQNDTITTQMNKIKKEFLGKRVLGASESAMQVLSMWLMKTSRKAVSVSTSMKDECVSLPKPKSQLAQLHDDDEDVFATSVIDRYAVRPLALQNICLATFAVMYDVIQSSTQTGETEDVNTQEDMYNTENPQALTKMKLQKGLGVIRKRKQQAILCTRRYKVYTEPEKYYQTPNCVAFDIDLQDLEHNIPQSAWEMVAPNIAHDDRTRNVTGFYTIQNQEVTEDTTHEVSHDNTKNTTDTLCMLYAKAAKKQDMNFHDCCTHIQNLNKEQCHIVMYNRAWCKSYISAVRHGENQKGYRIFLSGPGGTGKSCCTSDTKRYVTIFETHSET